MRLLRAGQRSTPPLNCGVKRLVETVPQVRMHREKFALVRLSVDDPMPDWLGGKFWSFIRSPGGVSIFCASSLAPDAVVHSKEWCCFELLRSSVSHADGYLSALATSLRSVQADLFVISAVENDYFFCRTNELGSVLGVLNRDGYLITYD